MELHIVLILLACTIMSAASWSIPYYPIPEGPHRAPIRITRFAPPPPPGYRLMPVRVADPDDARWQRAKRNHEDDYGRDSDYSRDSDFNRDDYSKDDDYSHRDDKGVTGPVHTFVKTDKNANYKWGVRHHVGNKYAS